MAAKTTMPNHALPLVQGAPIAFVTTMRPDGRMSTNPMSVVYDDDGLFRLSTTTKRFKYRNLKADDRITLCIVQPGNLNKYLEVRGRATVEIDEGLRFFDRMLRKYGIDGAANYPYDKPDDVRVVITMRPERFSSPWIPYSDKPPYEKDAAK